MALPFDANLMANFSSFEYGELSDSNTEGILDDTTADPRRFLTSIAPATKVVRAAVPAKKLNWFEEEDIDGMISFALG